MIAEVTAFERVRTAFSEEVYKFLIARVVIFHLKNNPNISSKTDLYKAVNNVLKSYGIKPVSYEFVKKNV